MTTSTRVPYWEIDDDEAPDVLRALLEHLNLEVVRTEYEGSDRRTYEIVQRKSQRGFEYGGG